MASTITVPSRPEVGAYSDVIATAMVTEKSDFDARVANELVDIATAAVADINALQAGTTITGVNGTTIAAGGALTTGQVLRATGAAAAAWGAVNLAAAAAVTGVLPAANVDRQVGLVHQVRGIVTANVAALGTFTVAGNDGLTYVEGDRVGLVGQSTASQNGVYVVGVVGGGTAALTRAADWAAAAVLPAGSAMHANEGTLWAHSEWFASVAGSITVATTAPAFYPRKQSGTTAAMSGTPGTINIPNLWLLSTTKSHISYVVNTKGGTQGFLECPVAARTAGAGNGEIDISSTANETSTIDWAVFN